MVIGKDCVEAIQALRSAGHEVMLGKLPLMIMIIIFLFA